LVRLQLVADLAFKEEINAGVKTASSVRWPLRPVVTAAGLVSRHHGLFVFADLRILGQIGPRSLSPAVRHTDRAFVHDAVDRSTAGRWFWCR